MKSKRILATLMAALIACGSAVTLPTVYAEETIPPVSSDETIAPETPVPTEQTLTVGESMQLPVSGFPDGTSVSYTSSDVTTVSVDPDGTIHALQVGTAIITVTAGNETATCTITVNEPMIDVDEIKLNKTALSLVQGKTYTLTATITPSDATDKTITYQSSNTSIATVSSSGKITAKKAGVVTITATAANNKTANCKVTIKLAAPTTKISSYSPTAVKLSWNKITGASGYVVYRSTSKTGTYKKVGSTAGCSSTSYTDKKVTAGTKYYYKVKACGTTSDANSANSDIISATTRLKTPTVTAKRASYNSIKVSWNKVSGATGYTIYRATSKTGTYKKIATVKSNATSYTNKSLTTDKTYYYKVVATGKKASYKSAASSIVSAKPTLATISGVKTTVKGTSQITLTWNKVSGATGYQVYRATSKNGTYKKIATVKTNSYTNSGLKINTNYYYKVRAVKGSVAGSFSAVKAAKISHTHSWTNTYKTVSHPATYTTVTVPTYGWESVKICDWCKQKVNEDGTCGCVKSDKNDQETIRTMHNEYLFVQDGVETYRVENTKAYTTKVMTGKKCSTCGETVKVAVDYNALDAKHHVHDYVTNYDVVHHDATYTTVETPERKLICHDICNGCSVDMTGWSHEQVAEHSTTADQIAFENFKRLSGSNSYTEFINTYANGNGPAHGYPDDYNLYCGGYHSEYKWEYTGNTTKVDKCVTAGYDEEVESGQVCTICGNIKK